LTAASGYVLQNGDKATDVTGVKVTIDEESKMIETKI